MSIFEWSTTAGSNATADGNINWAEGQAPSTVNNSARAEMAALASYFQGVGGALTTAGTGSAYTLTLADAPTAYTTSMLLLVKFHAVSASTTATINVNALGAKTLKLWDGSALPSASYIPVNAYGLIKYDGTDIRVFLPSIAAVTTQANTFTATTTISSAEAGSLLGPILKLDRTPVLSGPQNIGAVEFIGKDGLGNTTTYARVVAQMDDTSDTTEDGHLKLQTIIAGAVDNRLLIKRGAYTPNATGGDQGADTINAKSLYDDGVLLCAPIEEFKHGSYDAGAWAKLAPHGGLVAYEDIKAKGVRPGKADDFANELLSHEGIPGYWSKAEWAERVARTKKDDKGNDIPDRVSSAERHERLLLALDLQALAIADLTARVKALESA